MDVRLLKDREVAGILGVSRGKIWAMVKTGDLPPPFKLSVATTRWRSDTIETFINQRSQKHA